MKEVLRAGISLKKKTKCYILSDKATFFEDQESNVRFNPIQTGRGNNT